MYCVAETFTVDVYYMTVIDVDSTLMQLLYKQSNTHLLADLSVFICRATDHELLVVKELLLGLKLMTHPQQTGVNRETVN